MATRQILGLWPFIWSQTRWRWTLTFVMAVALIWLLARFGTDWWGWVEPFVTLLTLGLVVFVRYEQFKEEWRENHLPKRLTVHFYFEGREVMRCENAHLAAEGDIRALAQQIGRQMNENKDLHMAAPDVELSEPMLDKTQMHVHYVARVVLMDLPSTLAGLGKHKIRLWRESKGSFVDQNGKPTYQDAFSAASP